MARECQATGRQRRKMLRTAEYAFTRPLALQPHCPPPTGIHPTWKVE